MNCSLVYNLEMQCFKNCVQSLSSKKKPSVAFTRYIKIEINDLKYDNFK